MTRASSYGISEQMASPSDVDAHAERLRLKGMTVLDGGFSPEELTRIAQRLDDGIAEQRDRAGERLEAIGEHDTLRCCLAHDELFVRLASHARVLAVCRRLLGDYVVLTQQNGIVNRQGESHRQTAFHRDLPYQHFVCSRPIAITALFCADEFTRVNGATVVLPGTHREEEFPSESFVGELETVVEAPRGAYIVLDSMLFHRAGHNTSEHPRRAVNHVYGLPFVAQQISIPDVLGGRYADDPTLGRLLGYETAPAESVEAWWQRRDRRRRG